MCILFFQLNKSPENGAYRLILANNRDEYWARPTSTAEFWGKDGQCLSGLDQQPTREGGTWIGINKRGQVGVLLNILGENLPDRKGRGFLVSNFLTSGSSAETYLNEIATDTKTHNYNGFHLVVLEAGGQSPASLVLSEKTGDPEDKTGFKELPLSEFHGFGNSASSKPWQKVVHGRSEFKKIVEKHSSPDSKKQLFDDLITLLDDRTPHIPDSVLEGTCAELGYPHNIAWERSACCVWSPSIQYGTRTNTVILIDWSGKCDYIERTLTTPVQDQHQHTTKTFSFQLDLQSQ